MSDVKNNFHLGLTATSPFCLICLGLISITTAVSSLLCGLTNPQGPQSYDPSAEVCCNGMPYQKRYNNGTILACCDRDNFGYGQTLYDETMEMCCGPYLVPRFDGEHRERSCCKGVDETQFPGEIVAGNQFCCGGKVYDISDTLGCCDAMNYDVTKAICCQDQDMNTVKLHNIAPVPSIACCSTELYNISDYSGEYCSEQVIPNEVKPINIQNYNGREYDSSKEVPCIGAGYEEEPTFVDIPEKYRNKQLPHKYGCCNKEFIDLDTNSCCSADTRRGIVEHPIPKGEFCCGNSSVRNAPECCNGVPNILHERKENVIYGCCGTVYTSTDRCCNGKEIPLESACCGGKEYDRNQPLECCGDHIYNTNKKVCCASSSNIKTPKHKERSDHNACCRWTQTSYNDITHECTDKGIEEKKKKKKKKMKKKKKETDTRPCPFCTDWLPIGLCTRKKNYAVNITGIEHQRTGTVITGHMDNGEPIKVRTPYQCQCFKVGSTYIIYSNRRLRKNKEEEYRLRIKRNDVVIQSEQTLLQQIKEGCKIWRKVFRARRQSIGS